MRGMVPDRGNPFATQLALGTFQLELITEPEDSHVAKLAVLKIIVVSLCHCSQTFSSLKLQLLYISARTFRPLALLGSAGSSKIIFEVLRETKFLMQPFLSAIT
jgi:hypothetical protein